MTPPGTRDVAGAPEDRVRALFRRFRRDRPAPVSTPGLTREQLTVVHRLAFEHARAMRIAAPRASLLADSIVGSLVQGP